MEKERNKQQNLGLTLIGQSRLDSAGRVRVKCIDCEGQGQRRTQMPGQGVSYGSRSSCENKVKRSHYPRGQRRPKMDIRTKTRKEDSPGRKISSFKYHRPKKKKKRTRQEQRP